MRPDERELAAMCLRQIASEVGMELDDDRLARLVGLLESTVDGTRAAVELVLEDELPAFVPDLFGDERS